MNENQTNPVGQSGQNAAQSHREPQNQDKGGMSQQGQNWPDAANKNSDDRDRDDLEKNAATRDEGSANRAGSTASSGQETPRQSTETKSSPTPSGAKSGSKESMGVSSDTGPNNEPSGASSPAHTQSGQGDWQDQAEQKWQEGEPDQNWNESKGSN